MYMCVCLWQVKCSLSNLAKREPEGHLFKQVSIVLQYIRCKCIYIYVCTYICTSVKRHIHMYVYSKAYTCMCTNVG